MTEQKRSQNLVVLVVKDNEGNIIPLTDKNVEIVTVTKKFSLDVYKKVQETEGAFIVMI